MTQDALGYIERLENVLKDLHLSTPYSYIDRPIEEVLASKPTSLSKPQPTSQDAERLDYLEAQSEHGYGWVARKSALDRGYRVHQDPSNIHNYTVREAIDAAMKESK